MELVLCMLAFWVEEPNSDYFKKHLARIPDYLWVAEDGMKMQVCAHALSKLTVFIDLILIELVTMKVVASFDFRLKIPFKC